MKGAPALTMKLAVGLLQTDSILTASTIRAIGRRLLTRQTLSCRRRRRPPHLQPLHKNRPHRRNAAVNSFISGGKPPSSSGGLSMSDARLDPVIAHRRMSDGSIADNEDYSRRILRVTNA